MTTQEGLRAGAAQGGPLIRSASFLIANQAVVSGLGFVFWILAARFYPQQEVGHATSLIAAAILLAVLSNLGLPYSLVRFLPNSPNPRALFSSILRVNFLAALAIAVAAVALVPALNETFSFLTAEPLLALSFVALVTAWSVELSIEQALVVARRAERTTAMLCVFALLRLPFPLIGLTHGASDLVMGWAVAMTVGVSLALLSFLPKALGGLAPQSSAPQPSFRELVGYGAANHAGNLLGLAAPMLMPIVILQVLGGVDGAAGAAFFYIAMSIAQLLYVVPAAVALAQFAEGARPGADFFSDRRRAFFMAFGLVLPGTAAMLLLSVPLLSIFGAAYAAGGSVLLLWLALASLAIVPETILATGHRLSGDLRPVILASGLASAMALGGAAVFLESLDLGVVGIAFLAGHLAGVGVLAAWPLRLPDGLGPRAPGPAGGAQDPGGGEGHGRGVVMVLNWNAGEHLARCVESLERTVPADTRILVLDNGSKDGSLESATRGHARIEVRAYGENLGFAGGYNRAIRETAEEFVILLNPDTIADRSGWVEELLAAAKRDPSLAVIAGKLVFADDPSRINSVGGLVYWWTGPVDVGFGDLDTGQYGAGFEPFAACGGAMLVRRDAFLAVGGFDEKMFAYIEDVDLAWRMRLRGMRIGFAPRVVIRHKFSVTLGTGISDLKVYLTNRNYLRAMLRNYSATTLLVALPSYALWTAAKLAGAVGVERSPKIVSAIVRSVGWNFAHLADTLEERRRIQATRVVSDRAIRQKMSGRGFEPWSSVRRRLSIMRHGVAGVSK